MRLAFAVVLLVGIMGAPSSARAQCFGTTDGTDPRWDASSDTYTPAPGDDWSRNAVSFTDAHGQSVTRWYWRFTPASAPGAGVPMVVALHGGSATFSPGEHPEGAGWGFHHLAEAAGWIVVHPEGAFDPAGLECSSGDVSRSWNDGRFFGADQEPVYANENDVDDVGFVRELIDLHVASHGVDPDRVYAVGISNGGAMVHRLVGETSTSDRFAAVATNISTLPAASDVADTPAFAPLAPIPSIHLFGELDGLTPAAGGRLGAVPGRFSTVGGCSDGFPTDCTKGILVEEVPGRGYGTSRDVFVASWEIANGVSEYADDTLPDDDGDGLLMRRSLASNPGRLADLHLYEMDGGGHRNWGQSSTGSLGPVCLSRVDCDGGSLVKTETETSTFDACWSELAWEFFAQH